MPGDTKRPATSTQSTGESLTKRANKFNKQPDTGVSSATEYQGQPLADLGGSGCCAYELWPPFAQPFLATLCTQVSSHRNKYDHFKESVAVDPRCHVEVG